MYTKYVSLSAFDCWAVTGNISDGYATVERVIYALQPTSPSCDMSDSLVHRGAVGNIFYCVDRALCKHCRHKEKCLCVCGLSLQCRQVNAEVHNMELVNAFGIVIKEYFHNSWTCLCCNNKIIVTKGHTAVMKPPVHLWDMNCFLRAEMGRLHVWQYTKSTLIRAFKACVVTVK